MRRELYTAEVICDGEGEIAYFEKLQELINNSDERCNNVKFHTSTSKNISKTVKSIKGIYRKDWLYIIDKESQSKVHRLAFEEKLKKFKEIKKFDKNSKLFLGYSNVSLELWLLLHKTDFSKPVACAEDYWEFMKKNYGLNDVQSFDAYKANNIFKSRVLAKITLDEVRNAIKRAENIEKNNKSLSKPQKMSGFEYYEINPALSIQQVVKYVFEQVGIL